MAYCTVTDIYSVLPQRTVIQLTDDTNAGVVNTTFTDAAIAEADALIDTYLRKQVDTPLTTVPTEIKNASVKLSIYNLYMRRLLTHGDGIDQGIRSLFEDTEKWLKDVARGAVFIETETTITSAGRYTSNKTSSDRVYTSTCLDQY